MTAKRTPNGLQRFVWWIACTDEEAILLCSPVTRFYQTTAGVMILITGVLAFISGSYAIFQVVRNELAAFLIGSIYALAIISIDRYIVSARGSSIGWVRLPLAVLIGFVIAVPLELRLLQERINKELARQQRSENQGALDRRNQRRDALHTRITKLEQDTADQRVEIAKWGSSMEAEVVGRVRTGRSGIAGEGPAYRAAHAQKQLHEGLLRKAEAELERLRGQEAQNLQQIDKEYDRSVIQQSYDLLARYEALHAIEAQHPEALRMGWAITLLLVVIELFPALIKLTTPYTAYTALVEAREREDIQRVHSFANHNLRNLPLDPDDAELAVIGQTTDVKDQQLSNSVDDATNRKKRRAAGMGA